MAARSYVVRTGESACAVEIAHDGTVRVGNSGAHAEAIGDGEWRVVIDGRAHRLFAAGRADEPWIWFDGVAYRPEVVDGARPTRTRAREAGGSLAAPMPATVRAIPVSVGDVVARGDTLVVLEAMKMELPLKAPAAGTVKAIGCEVGELVQPGAPLVELE